MDYAEASPLDEVVGRQGVRILIDPKAVMFLVGRKWDFKRDKLGDALLFTNPNQTEACGCGRIRRHHAARNEAET